jgi:hypothetical protein
MIAMSGLITRMALVAGLLIFAVPAAAQKQRPVARAPIARAPVAVAPPSTCRIWYRDLPPEQQPRPTDCRSARRQAAITGGEVLVGSAEPGGAFRFSGDWDARYRRDVERREARDEERNRRDRDRDWRDGTWNDRDWRDDLEPWR